MAQADPHRAAASLAGTLTVRVPLLRARAGTTGLASAPKPAHRKKPGMNARAESPAAFTHREHPSWRLVAYWLATAAVAGELGLGGSWDVARLPSVARLVTHLGYPSYFLVLLGVWKVLGAIALIIPGRPLLKEWAYAGAFFTYSGAIVSHITTGYALGELSLAAPLAALTILSWALRPASRRTSRQEPAAPAVPVRATARG